MILYVSHSGGQQDDPDWWIVEPRNDPQRLEDQVRSLLRTRRRVLQVIVHPLGGEVHELTDLPQSMIDAALAELRYR